MTTNVLNNLKVSPAKKAQSSHELLAIDLYPSGAMLLHLSIADGVKILAFNKLMFDPSMSETERRGAYTQFISKFPQKKRPKVVIAWHEGITFRQLPVPPMPTDDLLKAFFWDLKKKYYFEPKDNLFGYQQVMEIEGVEGSEMLYNLFYCEKKAAMEKLDFIHAIGVEIQSFVPAMVAVGKFCGQDEPPIEKDTLVCDLHEVGMRILVFRDDNVMLSRNLPLTIQDNIWTDEVLSKISEELHKTIDYYEGQRHTRPMGKIVFSGTYEAGRILDFMMPKFSIPVSLPNVEGFMTAALSVEDKQFIQNHPGIFASSLGAVMVLDPAINLLPEDIKSKQRRSGVQKKLYIGLFALVLVFALLMGMAMIEENWNKTQVVSLKKQYDEINQKKEVSQGILNKEKKRRLALKGYILVAPLLKDISLRTPPVIALSEFQYTRSDSTLMIKGEITDTKKDVKLATQYANNLNESTFIKSSVVDSTEISPEDGVLRFKITSVIEGMTD